MKSIFSRIVCASITFLIVGQSYAAVQTFNYISLDDKPLYANRQFLPYANPDALKGGLAILSATGTFDNFNSMNGRGSAADGVQFLYDSLMKSSLDESGVMYPLLAQSITYDPDKPKFAVFHLNPKAKFSNGQPVTAKDVEYTFKKLLSEGAPGLRIYFSDIQDIKALNRHDVRFDFKSDDNKEMPLIVANISIFSEKDLKNKDFTKVTNIAPIGSGPYIVEQIDAGRTITYKRNPHYWAKDIMANRGAYNFDRIKYIYYRTLDIAFEGFKAGQYTIHTENYARRWATEYNFNAAKQGLIAQLEFHHENPIVTQSFVLNSRRPPLNDIYFRQAMSYAYDFEWLNRALFFGKYKRLQSYFDNSELAARGVPTLDEQHILKLYQHRLSSMEKAGVYKNWVYPVSDGSGFNRQNLLIARDILLKHGYQFNQKGQLLDKKRQPIKFEFLIHQDGLQRTLMPFVRNLKKLGIQVDVRQVDVPQYIERKKNYDYDIVTDALPQSSNPGNEQARFWSSRSADETGNYNYAGIKNPVIDDVISQLIRAPNRKALIAHTRVLDRLLRANYYQILTYGKDAEWYAYWDMYDRPKTQPKLDVGMEYWWVNPAKAQKVSRYFRTQK